MQILLKSGPLYLFLYGLFILSCGQDYNSSTFDSTRFKKTKAKGSEKFIAFYEVVFDKCVSCHKGEHNDWANLITAEQWQDDAETNLILKNDIENSVFIQRLAGWGSIGDMPEGGLPPLTSEEYKIVTDWIESL